MGSAGVVAVLADDRSEDGVEDVVALLHRVLECTVEDFWFSGEAGQSHRFSPEAP